MLTLILNALAGFVFLILLAATGIPAVNGNAIAGVLFVAVLIGGFWTLSKLSSGDLG